MLICRVTNNKNIKATILDESLFTSFENLLVSIICLYGEGKDAFKFKYSRHKLIIKGEVETYPFFLRDKLALAKVLAELLEKEGKTNLLEDYKKNGAHTLKYEKVVKGKIIKASDIIRHDSMEVRDVVFKVGTLLIPYDLGRFVFLWGNYKNEAMNIAFNEVDPKSIIEIFNKMDLNYDWFVCSDAKAYAKAYNSNAIPKNSLIVVKPTRENIPLITQFAAKYKLEIQASIMRAIQTQLQEQTD